MFLLKKYFFINKFYLKILNYSYLFFIKNNNLKFFNSSDIIKINSNEFLRLKIYKRKKVFLDRNINFLNFNFINNNYNNNLNLKYIDYISYFGFFINNNYKNKFINYFIFFKNNYNLFLFIIHLNINIIKYLLYIIMFKIIYIINYFKVGKENKK
jgi:hypothetical protein